MGTQPGLSDLEEVCKAAAKLYNDWIYNPFVRAG